MTISPLELIRQATPAQRRTLLAASLGWALDAFDAMLYSLVLALLMHDLAMTKTVAGFLGTLTLLASGIGGMLFGFLVCFGASHQRCHARGSAVRARVGHGRRVEHWHHARCRKLAY